MKRLLLILLALTAVHTAGAGELRVMSFNVRYPNPNDGANFWDNRRELAVAAVRARDPDIIGTQELFYTQGQYLAGKLPGYTWFGISRRGNREDEHMGVFYKTAKLKLVESGNFWLSETPEIPGSMSWDVSLPRMVTWGLFEIIDGGGRFYFYNTHFPHRGQDAEARRRCAEVIASRIDALPSAVAFLMTGDFNDPAGGQVHEVFNSRLKDAWETAAATSGPEATGHGFTGAPRRRIDWIFYRAPWKVLEAETMMFNHRGRYLSDHFPVFAVFQLD